MAAPGEAVRLSSSHFAKAIVRRYRLGPTKLLLDVGCGNGERVACLRSRGVMAFGIFDGVVPPRDPQAQPAGRHEVPVLQPALLYQSLPFAAHSFDCIVLHDSQVYRGPLTGPEACTATANLLACLKPGRPLLYFGTMPLTQWEAHITAFPGEFRPVELGIGGLAGLFRRLAGARVRQPGAEFVIPQAPVSRLEWHRAARSAVMAARRQPAA